MAPNGWEMAGEYRGGLFGRSQGTPAPAKAGLVAVDWIVVIIYFGAVIATGLISSFLNRGSVGGYFLAGQNSNWFLVGSSLFASNIGSGHFIGLAGSAAKSGIAVSTYELHAVVTLFFLGWIFYPVYRSAGVYTLPEYMSKRYGGKRIQMYLAILSLFLYIFTKISADLYSGAIFMEQAMPNSANLYVWAVILVGIAALFTIMGGLTAVIWTDTIQTVIMVVGALILMGLSFSEVGGYEAMKEKFPLAISDSNIMGSKNKTYKYASCGRTKSYWLRLMLPIDDPDLPWTGVIFGITVNATWYWCTDQVIVQRVLSSKNMLHGKMACTFASYLKVFPMWLIVFPGMISRILYSNRVACNEPELCKEICNREGGCHDIAYPLMVVELLPKGLRGLMISVMMSALISSLTSVFSSTSTIFTIDIWQRMHKKASDMELMLVGRLAVVVLIGISIAWVPIVKNADTLFNYIQKMTAYFGAPVCSAFVMAILVDRTTEGGVFWGMLVGSILGLVRGLWEIFGVKSGLCGTDIEQPAISKWVTELHFLHFGPISFVLTTLIILVISFLSKPMDHALYQGKTFFTRNEEAYEVSNPDALVQQEQPKYLKALLGNKGYKDQPAHKQCCLWLCGLEDMLEVDKTSPSQLEVKQRSNQIKRSLFENRKLSILASVNMAVCFGFICAYWIYFSTV